jgi:hypothetical protein
MSCAVKRFRPLSQDVGAAKWIIWQRKEAPGARECPSLLLLFESPKRRGASEPTLAHGFVFKTVSRRYRESAIAFGSLPARLSSHSNVEAVRTDRNLRGAPARQRV